VHAGHIALDPDEATNEPAPIELGRSPIDQNEPLLRANHHLVVL